MKTPKTRLLNLTVKNSDTMTSKNVPLSGSPQAQLPRSGCNAGHEASEAGLSTLKEFRAAAAALAILFFFPVEAPASPRVAATVVEAALPVATKVAAIEAVEKTAGAAVSRNVSTIVADSAAQAAARRAATATARQAAPTAIEAAGNIVARPDRSKEILAVGAAAGLGTGLYSGMSKTGDGIKSSLQEVGKGASDAIRETPKSIPFLTAASAVTALVFVMLLSRLIPARKAVPDHREETVRKIFGKSGPDRLKAGMNEIGATEKPGNPI